MKRVWLYAGVAVALAGFASVAVTFANPLRRGEPDDAVDADAMPPYEVLSTVRGLGFDPISQPVRRGNYYVLHAYDARGQEMRIVADVSFGDIVSVSPARAANAAYAPQQQYYGGAGPRIIQVPDNYRSNGVIDVPQQLPQRRRSTTAPAKTYHRSVTAPDNDQPNDASNSAPAQEEPKPKLPPLRERRVLERPDAGLSPIYPTGRWRSRVEEFGQPPAAKRSPSASTNVDINTTGPDNPPIGYSPQKVKGTIRMIEPARPAEPAAGTEPTQSKDETVQTPAQDAAPAQANAEAVVKAIEPAAQEQQPAAQDDEQPPQNETRD